MCYSKAVKLVIRLIEFEIVCMILIVGLRWSYYKIDSSVGDCRSTARRKRETDTEQESSILSAEASQAFGQKTKWLQTEAPQ